MHRAGTGASRRPGFGRHITSQSSSLSLFQLHGTDEHTPDVMWLPHAAGQVVGQAKRSPAHIITPPMMAHRTRGNGRRPTCRTGCGTRVPSTNSRSRTPQWVTAHLYSYSIYTNKILFFLPPHTDLPPPSRRFQSILSLDLLFSGPATNHRHPHGEISKDHGRARPIEQQPRTNSP
jgi:hypothetical protein